MHKSRRSKRRVWIWGTIVLVIIVQLLYPSRWMTPFIRLDSVRVSGKSEAEIKTMLASDAYQQASIKIDTHGPVKDASDTVTLQTTGLQPDASRTVESLKGYSFWQRLIPFSIIGRGLLTDHAVKVASTGNAFDTFVKAQKQSCTVAAVNASITVKDGKASLVASKEGQTCDVSMVRDQLLATALRREGTTVTLSAKKLAPIRDDKYAKSALKTAQKLMREDIKLSVAGKTYTLGAATLGSFLSLTPDAKDGKKLTIDLDSEAVRSYLATIEKKIYRAPTASSKGLALNYSATKNALTKQILEKGDGTVEGTTVNIPAGVAVDKLYAADAAGLQELLNDIVAAKGQYGISVRMLDGAVTSSRGDTHYHPASTYKLYVAYGLLKGIEAGKFHWNDQSTGGLTINQCFEKMIVYSDNTCAEWFGGTVGWATINKEVHAIGLNNTSTLYGQQQSTANDETLFLIKLQNGDLLKQTERDRLIALMKRQVYREGIPTGLKGITVADKVGFLNADLHDSAIVYAPKQTYAMTIMTTGSSWANIADAAAQIQLQLDRM